MAKGNDKRGKKSGGGNSGQFKKGHEGNPGNSGGKAGRSGRKPDYFHEQCRQLIEDNDLLQVVADIATAKDSTKRDKIMAVRFLASYAHGKPPETIRIEGEIEHTHSPAEQLMHQLDAMGKRQDGKRVH